MPVKTDIHLFVEGVKPMWEDESNKNGGRWFIKLQKGYANKLWEDLVLALIGEQFEYSEAITGIIVSTKPKGDTLSIWHKNAQDYTEANSLRDDFVRLLQLPPSVYIDYEDFHETMNAGQVRKEGPGKVGGHGGRGGGGEHHGGGQGRGGSFY